MRAACVAVTLALIAALGLAVEIVSRDLAKSLIELIELYREN